LPKAYPKELKTLGEHLRKRRLELKLLQKEVALILGVHETTIWNWERDRSSPNLHHLPKVIQFLGYLPFQAQAETLGEKIVNSRRLSGITQKELAKRLGVDPSTLARWERNESRPQKRLSARLAGFLVSWGLSFPQDLDLK
jgi:transcriptional regulator with XRE-family HTH domain